MRLLRVLVALLLSAAATEAAIDTDWFRNRYQSHSPKPATQKRQVVRQQAQGSLFKNDNTTKYAVNGAAIPEVDFDVGESYAGMLPVGGDSNGELFFWFFPTTDSSRPKEIILWLNGGPGCSSLDGFLKENGPFIWPSGTYKPISNPYSWHRLTNVVWVEQPIGTGFSSGNVTARSEDDVARQFMGFWKNFIELFGMQGYKVYITGESYAGMYCPFIASNMLDANDTTNFNVKGMMIYDPVIGDFAVGQNIAVLDFVNFWAGVHPFNDTVRAQMVNMSKACGFDDYLHQYLTFPPSGQQPSQPPGYNFPPDCDMGDLVYNEIQLINPGYNVYQVTQMVPVPWDVLGFPSALMYTPPGTQVYFNRTDVQKAINAPVGTDWSICSHKHVFVNGTDESDYSGIRAIPNVIQHTNNVVIGHGANDFVLQDSGTLMTIQNMTWNGKMGFQDMPSDPFFIPFHPQDDATTTMPMGVMGTTHTERGLTWVHVTLTGHMIPEWQGAGAFRQVEFLLGRVNSLSSTQPLSIYSNYTQPSAQSLGKGTGRVLGRLLNDTSSGSGTCTSGSGSSTPAPSTVPTSTASRYSGRPAGWLAAVAGVVVVAVIAAL